MRTWDHLKWWLLFALIVWFLLVAVFLIDHARGYSDAMISERIWRTLGEIILLKWVTKYQTLIAGILAVAAAGATIFAAMIAVENSNRDSKRREIKTYITEATFLAELFRQASLVVAHNGDDFKPEKWGDVLSSIKHITLIHPNFSSDILYLWSSLNDYSKGKMGQHSISVLRATSTIAHFTLKDIYEHYNSNELPYVAKPIKANDKLVKSLKMEQSFLRSLNPNTKILRVVEPMNRYVDFGEITFN